MMHSAESANVIQAGYTVTNDDPSNTAKKPERDRAAHGKRIANAVTCGEAFSS